MAALTPDLDMVTSSSPRLPSSHTFHSLPHPPTGTIHIPMPDRLRPSTSMTYFSVSLISRQTKATSDDTTRRLRQRSSTLLATMPPPVIPSWLSGLHPQVKPALGLGAPPTAVTYRRVLSTSSSLGINSITINSRFPSSGSIKSVNAASATVPASSARRRSSSARYAPYTAVIKSSAAEHENGSGAGKRKQGAVKGSKLEQEEGPKVLPQTIQEKEVVNREKITWDDELEDGEIMEGGDEAQADSARAIITTEEMDDATVVVAATAPACRDEADVDMDSSKEETAALGFTRWLDLGVARFREGKFLDAPGAFNEALALAPPNRQLVVLDSRSATYDRLGRPDLALQDAMACIEVAPESPKGYLRAARLYRRMRLYQKSLDIYRLGISKVPFDKVSELSQGLANLQITLKQVGGNRYDPMPAMEIDIWEQILLAGQEHDWDFALKCSQVNRTWRAMTLRCPRCWRRLRLKGDDVKQVGKLEAFWERSKGSLNEIRLMPKGNASRALGQALKSKVAKVESFYVEVTKDLHLDKVMEPLEGKFVALRHLELVDKSKAIFVLRAPDQQRPTRLDFGALSKSSARLETLKVSGIRFGHLAGTRGVSAQQAEDQALWEEDDKRLNEGLRTSKLPIHRDEIDKVTLKRLYLSPKQLSSLKTLEVQHCSVELVRPWASPFTQDLLPHDIVYNVLSRATNLESVRFQGCQYRHESFKEEEEDYQLKLPKLIEYEETRTTQDELRWQREPDVQTTEGSMAVQLFMPKLRTLHRVQLRTWSSLADFVERSGSKMKNLTSVTISDIELDQNELNDFLEEATSLKHLEVIRFSTNCLERIRSAPAKYPDLESLTFTRCEGNGGPIVRLVKGRQMGGPQSQASSPSQKAEDNADDPYGESWAIDGPGLTKAAQGKNKAAPPPVESAFTRIQTLVLKDCKGVEVSAESWLSEHVEDFSSEVKGRKLSRSQVKRQDKLGLRGPAEGGGLRTGLGVDGEAGDDTELFTPRNKHLVRELPEVANWMGLLL